MKTHDRGQFEVIAVSYGVDDRSDLRQRLKRSFDQFIDTGALSDFEIARLMRQMEIDIAVDLTGLTASCRPGILTLRPAPVQVNYLGYAGSLGARNIDYIVADRIVIPEQEQKFYDEKVVWLPPPFLPFPAPVRHAAGFARRSGIARKRRRFCLLQQQLQNQPPDVFHLDAACWHRWREAFYGSAGRTQPQRQILRRKQNGSGIAADRIIFAPRVATAEQHLARLALADLFLDTLPYNAHSTAADALSAGVPVLTCRGESFAGRVAASLVTAADIPEFITANLPEYEARALALANDRSALDSARHKLRSGSIIRTGWTAGSRGIWKLRTGRCGCVRSTGCHRKTSLLRLTVHE